MALEVSPSGQDQRWPKILAKAGMDSVAIDLNAFVNPGRWAEQRDIPGAVPGYRWRQKVYRKTERFFSLCAQYGVRTAVKKAARRIFGKKAGPAPAAAPHTARGMAAAYAKNSLRTELLFAPVAPRDSQDADMGAPALAFARESIRICAECGCANVVIQPLSAGVKKGDEWQVNRRFYLELLPLAQKHGVGILLENQSRDFNGHLLRGVLADPAEAIQWIDDLNSEAKGESFGLCLNVDTCHQCRQNVGEYIRALGGRLKALRSSFTPAARFNYREIILALRKIRFDGVFVLDARWFLEGLPDSLLAPMLKLVAGTLLYLRMQIELEKTLRKYPQRILFGSGLMFENYMRNYGQIYPPLFACDNSPEKWGMEIQGVRIFPPQKLKRLAPDCAVFICNRFYAEMEKQLEELGVENIERFNDEILPG